MWARRRWRGWVDPEPRRASLDQDGETAVTALLIRFRFLAFAAAVVLLAVLLRYGRRVEYEQSLTSFFPDGEPIVTAYQRASDLFGNDNFVFIGYDDPRLLTPEGMDRLGELVAAVQPGKIEAVTAVESLDGTPMFWRVDDELVRIESLPAFLRTGAVKVALGLLKNVGGAAGASLSIGQGIRAAKPADLAALRERITTHPLLRGVLVNPAGTSTVVVVHLKGMAEQDIKATIGALRTTADAFAARHRIVRPALVGPPVLLADGFSMIEVDGRRLAAAGMALIALVTLTATRSLWWSIVPMLAGWTVWLGAEHVLGVLGLKLSLSGGPLVAQIIVLTMPAASHLAIHFQDAIRHGVDRAAATIETLRAVTTPILWCAATGALGYAALVTSDVVPVKQFGAVLAVCTLIASILTLLISPLAMRPPFTLEWPIRPGSRSRAGSTVQTIVTWVDRHPLAIVLGVVALVAPVALGALNLEFESNYINAFKPESRVVKDYQFVESRLGGIGLVSMVVPLEGDLDAAKLETFRALDEAIRAGGDVTGVLSLATVLDPEGRLAALPSEKAAHALATKLEMIAAAPQGNLMRSFWNREQGQARVLVRVLEQQSAPTKEATFQRALAETRSHLGPDSFLTGLSYLLTQTTRGVMATSWTTFLWAVASIFLMLALAYRNPALAVLAILPSLLAVGLVVGLMGRLGIKLDIATALVASVALGLSVDDTFHCLLQFREHRKHNDSFHESLFNSYAVSGPGVLLSSVAVALGFAVLWMSQFVPFANFGMMVGIATFGSSLGNLVVLPAFLSLGNRLRE